MAGKMGPRAEKFAFFHQEIVMHSHALSDIFQTVNTKWKQNKQNKDI